MQPDSENYGDHAYQDIPLQPMVHTQNLDHLAAAPEDAPAVDHKSCGEFVLFCLPWRRRRGVLGSTRQEVRQRSRTVRTDAAALASKAFDCDPSICGHTSNRSLECQDCNCGCSGTELVARVEALERSTQSLFADRAFLRTRMKNCGQSQDEFDSELSAAVGHGLRGRVEALESAQRRLIARRTAAIETLGISCVRFDSYSVKTNTDFPPKSQQH